MNDATIVSLQGSGADLWVTVRNSWRDHLQPRELVESLVEKYQELHPDPGEPDDMAHRSLADLPWEQVRLFFELRHNYVTAQSENLDRRGANPNEPVRTSVPGKAEAVWVSGQLQGLAPDPDWIGRATAQDISDTFTKLLADAPRAPGRESPAMKRATEDLEAFWRRA